MPITRCVMLLGLLLMTGTPALANVDECGALIRRIDRILTMAKLRPEDAARVRRLREQGLALYRQGRPDCIAPLNEAAVLLGIKKTREK